MLVEILLGAGVGYALRQYYYDYVFTPFPEVRVTGISALAPLIGALALAWCVDLLYRLVRMPFTGWAKGAFWNRGLGLSLFAGAFLQIEAAKIATEYRFDPTATASVVGALTLLLAWTRVRHLRYRSLLTAMPDDSPSMLLAEASKTVVEAKASPKPKKSERSLKKSASSAAPKPPKRKLATAAPSVDDVWAAFDKEIRSRSRAQILAQRGAAAT